MELLPQLQPCMFERVRIVTPVRPAGGNRLEGGVHEGELPEVLENLGIFVVLDAVADGFQSYPGSGF